MNPIGYMRSPFKFKNGTPRQPTVCSHARGSLTIEKSVFNNPEHSLEGLEDFSHVWILFVFHKNNNDCTKAKVKPPRLNGKKVGLFSTRCPYRPNNIGLTLAKLESVRGATVNVSGIDILDGTPVLDIKPYIPQYDCPALWPSTDGVAANGEPDNDEELADELEKKDDSTVCISSIGSGCDQTMCSEVKRYSRGHMEEFADADCTKLVSTHGNENLSNEQAAGLDFSGKYVNRIDSFEAKFGKIRLGSKQEEIIKCPENDSYVDHRLEDTKVHGGKVVQTEINKCLDDPGSEESVQIGSDKETATDSCDPLFPERTASENSSHTATWITKPNVEKLNVRFTRSAEEQLHLFSEISENKLYSLQYLKHSEVKEAIISILQEDPRSTYRRKHCKDNLYYFTVDIVHVTCWFDETIAEVLRLKPAALVQQCKSEYT